MSDEEFAYPSEDELLAIEQWDWRDTPGFLAFVRERWRWADDGYWVEEPHILTFHTGGWSGNEDLVKAMEKNTAIWSLLWIESRRGGHYQFDLTRVVAQ